MSSNQLVCIKRQEPSLPSLFEEMYINERLVDVTLSCCDGQLQAHKLVLAAYSPYFSGIFDKLPNQFHFPIVVLQEMKIDDLRLLVDFMYRGQLTLSQERLSSIMKSAEFLQIIGLSSNSDNMTEVSRESFNSNNINNNNINNNNNNNNNNNKQFAFKMKKPISHSSAANRTSLSIQHMSASSQQGSSHQSNPQNLLQQQSRGRLHHCSVCWKTFREKANLKRHLQIHSIDRVVYACPDCNKTFSWKDNYIRHTKTTHHMGNVRPL